MIEKLISKLLDELDWNMRKELSDFDVLCI